MLALQRRGYRRFEVAIAFLLGIILLGFLYDTLKIGFVPGEAAGGFIPSFDGGDSVLLAAGILGATVMPHVIYLHSALTQDRIRPRNDDEKRALLRFQRLDVTIAMGIAGLVNMSMLIIAASLFFDSPLNGVDTIEGAYHGFDQLVGPQAALAFALALLASGLASSSVGTYAGQVVMQGFIGRQIPLTLRRADHDGARADRARDRREPDRRPRDEPGRAVVRDPVRARPADPPDAAPRRDGRARQPAAHDGHRRGWSRA